MLSIWKNKPNLSKDFSPPKNPLLGGNIEPEANSKWIFAYEDKSSPLGWSSEKEAYSNDKATLDFDSPVEDTSEDTLDKKTFKVKHVKTGKNHTIIFDKKEENIPDELAESQKKALEKWVWDEFGDPDEWVDIDDINDERIKHKEVKKIGWQDVPRDKKVFQADDGKLKIQISGDINDTRFDKVKTAVQKAFDDKFKICNKVGRDWSGECLTGNDVKKEWFTRKNWKEMEIKIPDDIYNSTFKQFFDANCAVGVCFYYDYVYSIYGCAGGGKQVLIIPSEDNMTTEAAKATQAICHELGHSMGMTIIEGDSKVPKGMTAVDKIHVDSPPGLYYSDAATSGKGLRAVHRGPHCAHGIKGAARKLTKDEIQKTKGSCIMYGGTTGDELSYCETCKDYIKARKLTDIVKPWKNRNDNDC